MTKFQKDMDKASIKEAERLGIKKHEIDIWLAAFGAGASFATVYYI